MAETWADCEICDRRFYCERDDTEGMHRCPVCGVPAARTMTVETE